MSDSKNSAKQHNHRGAHRHGYSIVWQYTTVGVLFGALFPLLALWTDLQQHDLTWTSASIVARYLANPLHWLIATAPFFLGLFAALAGRSKQKLMNLTLALEMQVAGRTAPVEQDVVKLKQCKVKQHTLSSLLATIIENMRAGILVEDESRRIALANQEFCRLFGLKRSPESLLGMDCGKCIEEISYLFAEPEQFLEEWATARPTRTSVAPGELRLADERIFERDHVTIYNGDMFYGNLWIYRDITTRKQTDNVIRNISEGVSTATGEAFFRSVVEYLAKMLDVSYAFIGKLAEKDAQKVHTLAMYAHGKIVDNFEYELANTPSQTVVGNTFCCYPKGVQQQFPHASLLAEMGIESYMGISLFDFAGEALGLLVVMDEKPLAEHKIAESMLQIFAMRISAEMERMRSEAVLRQSEQHYRVLIENALDVITVLNVDGSISYLGPSVERTLGYRPEDLIGKNAFEFLRPEELPKVSRVFSHLIENPWSSESVEHHFLHQNGSWCLLESKGQSLIDDSGVIGVVINSRDITERRKIDERVWQLSCAVEQSPSAIVITDPAGNIQYVNPNFTETTGYQLEDVLGENPRFLKSGFTTLEEYKDLWNTILAGEVWRGELLNKKKNGELYWVSLSISAVKNPEGAITHFLGIEEDITARKCTEAELQEAKEAAEAANRAKSEFLANMSHEIRTPMNGVLGMNRLLLDTELTEEQEEYAKAVQLSADSLLTIINDILDFSKIEAGKLEMEILDFNFAEMVDTLIEMIAQKVHEKGLELLVDVDPKIPAYLCGDSTRLRQILINFVGNAVKFTKQGEVAICALLCSENAAETRLRFEVRDTGIGIPAEKLGIIFESFSQADGSTTRKYGGTGLGLTISKQLVELMGGEIGVISEVGAGSTFWFEVTLPRASDEHGVNSEGSWQKDEIAKKLPGLHVLAIDDNASNRTILAKTLQRFGCEIEVAESAEAGLALLQKSRVEGNPYGLILLDMMMPVMDGKEAARRIRESGVSDAPIIVLSSSGQRMTRDELQSIGIDHYLIKPVREKHLREAMLRSLSGETIRQQLPNAMAKGLRGVGHSYPPFRILLAEDNAINQKLALRQLEKNGFVVDLVANGVEAVEACMRIDYDFILMDVQMPEMDGLEATAAIRAYEQDSGKHVPIIALTANAMQEDREKSLAAGMDDHVSKPMTIEEVLRAIDRLSTPVHVVDEVGRAAPAKAGFQNPDLAAFVARMDGDMEFVEELIKLFLESYSAQIAAIRAAIAAQDGPTLEHSAHKLKGTLANFVPGGEAVALAQALETMGENDDLRDADDSFARLSDAVERLSEQLATLLDQVKEIQA